jgi:heme exporter protein B
VWRDALLVAGKDLRVEGRSRVALNQVLPFALLVLVLFAFALDPDRGVLARAAAGLYWVAVLFSALLAVQRSQAVEAGDGTRDALRLSGLDPAGIFLGKAGAVAVQLVVLEVVLGAGVVVLYGVEPAGLGLLAATGLVATAGLAAAGTLYGVIAAGLRVRETLLPLLLLPVLAPVLIAATRASETALSGVSSGVATESWLVLLATFAAVYLGFGVVAFGPLLEDA